MAPEFGAESMIHRAVRQSIGYANAAVLHPRLTLSLAPPLRRLTVPRVRTKRATLRDILRMIPAERPGRQMAGMLRHLRATLPRIISR